MCPDFRFDGTRCMLMTDTPIVKFRWS